MLRHIVRTQTFTVDFLETLFKQSALMRDAVRLRGFVGGLEGKIVATLFYEESTRTRLSFEAAAYKLGASVVSTANARKFSSVSKGETLEDTIRTIDKYVDCIVLRHHEDDGAARAAHVSAVPVISGGSGAGQHPTQALLDLFTIQDELGQISGLTIALAGDLKHGRTVHSLAYLLAKYEGVKLFFISPPKLRMPLDICEYLRRHNVKYEEFNSFDDCVNKCDVLYQTRVQKERFDSPEEYEKSNGKLTIDRTVANSMLTDSIILHPLPRVDELRYSVDDNHRAKYFTQCENGLYVRIALLNIVMGETK